MSATEQQPRKVRRVALLTAGGLAPCLSSAVGGLIERYTEVIPEVELIAYRGGYRGLLLGDHFVIGRTERDAAALLHERGGSPLGNSRVKLANVKDCVKRGLVKPGQDPREVAARQLVKDRVDVLHTIGGDDTNTAAADLAAYLATHKYTLQVLGLPKTIDNDVVPVRLTLGAVTAAEQGARFFRNVVCDHGAARRMIIVHEVMGRSCGWLTAATAHEYMRLLDTEEFAPVLNQSRGAHNVHAVYIPEVPVNLETEAVRLRRVMDETGNVNIFVAEGAGADAIAQQLRQAGKEVPVDAFGHVKLDSINVGEWFGQRFKTMLGAEKLEVQKSGYFARAAPANLRDLSLIKSCTDHAVDAALAGESGVIGHDEERGGRLRAIEFDRIKGHKAFDTSLPWFKALLRRVGQPLPHGAKL